MPDTSSIAKPALKAAQADGWAIGLSGLCLVHCLALPLVALAAPAALGLEQFHSEFHLAFLSVAAAPNGENVIRTFIIIQNDKSDADSSLGKASGEDLVNKFTQASAGSTTTSGSATLSILQVPPASSSLVFTNVLLKDAAHVTE